MTTSSFRCRIAVGSPDSGAIAIETRSLLDLMRLAAANIELPAEGKTQAVRYGAPGLAGREIRNHTAAERPLNARVALEYRGRWYYIDNDDAASKQWFMSLQVLASAQLPPANDGVPMLTIPVTGRRLQLVDALWQQVADAVASVLAWRKGWRRMAWRAAGGRITASGLLLRGWSLR